MRVTKQQPFRIIQLLIFSVMASLAFSTSSKADTYKNSLKEALELDKNGFYEEAIEYWEKLRVDTPSNIRLFAGLKISGTNTKLGNLNRAVEVSQKLTESHPQQYESWFSFANTSGAIKKYPQAISAFKKTIELKPEEGLGKVGLAFAYFGDEKPDLAIEALKDAMKNFKANKNISWYRDCRLAIRQIKDFARFPPKYAELWLKNNLKRVQETFENSVLNFSNILKSD